MIDGRSLANGIKNMTPWDVIVSTSVVFVGIASWCGLLYVLQWPLSMVIT